MQVVKGSKKKRKKRESMKIYPNIAHILWLYCYKGDPSKENAMWLWYNLEFDSWLIPTWRRWDIARNDALVTDCKYLGIGGCKEVMSSSRAPRFSGSIFLEGVISLFYYKSFMIFLILNLLGYGQPGPKTLHLPLISISNYWYITPLSIL